MSRFCSNCGKEVKGEAAFCDTCGSKIESKKEGKETVVVVNNNTPAKKESNGFAIAGFVISLVSILCCGTFSFLGLIFSIVGLVNANKMNGVGKGMAITGIVISALTIILAVILYVLGFASSIVSEVSQATV